MADEFIDRRCVSREKLRHPDGRNYFVTYGPKYDLTEYKKPKDYSHIIPSGDDNGKGSKTLLIAHVDEIIERNRPKAGRDLNEKDIDNHEDSADVVLKPFEQCSFLEQICHPSLEEVPLASQLAREAAIWPKQSNEKKKLILDICQRLIRNDGSFIHLRLNSEEIDDFLLKTLCSAFEKNKYLQFAMLHNNAISDEGVQDLSMAFRWHPSIHTIWLGANQISDKGLKHLCDLLRRNPNIKDLNLSNIWPRETWSLKEQTQHPHVTHAGATLLARQLARGCSLTNLTLSDQRIRDIGAKQIFMSLPYAQIRQLSLKGNEITDESCLLLSSILSKQPKLEKLDLSYNGITDNGAIPLARDGLSANTVLRALDLSRNKIDDLGMAAFYDCVRTKNTTISILSLINNVSKDMRAEDFVHDRRDSMEGRQLLTFSQELKRQNPYNMLDQRQLLNSSSSKSQKPDSIGDFGRRLYSRSMESRSLSQFIGTPGSYGPFRDDYHFLKTRQMSAETREHLGDSMRMVPFEDSEKDRLQTPLQPMRITSYDITSDNFDLPFDNTNSIDSFANTTNSTQNDDTTNADIARQSSTTPLRSSSQLGKTLSIPYVGHQGTLPIRSATTRFRDSGNHLMYLRVSTPLDKEGEQPQSFLKIAVGREQERQRIIKERDNEEYREKKKDALALRPTAGRQLAAMKPPPQWFWNHWDDTIRRRYPKGIDRADGSTSLDTLMRIKDESGPLEKIDFSKKMKSGKSGDSLDGSTTNKSNGTTPIQALFGKHGESKRKKPKSPDKKKRTVKKVEKTTEEFDITQFVSKSTIENLDKNGKNSPKSLNSMPSISSKSTSE